jgi:hypothetical protein
VSGAGFSTYLASPPAIGGTTAAAGSFTTLSASSYVAFGGSTPASNPKVSLYGGIRFLATEAATATYTGIGSIASDTVSISTSGSERMRVDTGGNVKLSTAGTKILNSSGNPILQQTGSVLQVVANYPSSAAAYTQAVSTYAEISTEYRTSITPISTSSILILEWIGLVGGNNAANISTMKFYDVTNNADVGLSGISLGSRGIGHGSFRQVDNDLNDRDNIILRVVVPNTSTTARTYSIYHYSESGLTKYFNATSTDNNGCSYVKWHFTITEISA